MLDNASLCSADTCAGNGAISCLRGTTPQNDTCVRK